MFAKKSQTRSDAGFTLLELLIVISIIAILSVMLIIVINPAETLKKSRDSQRISDLNTLKTALGIYTVSTSTPHLGGNMTDTACKNAAGAYIATSRIFYSFPSDGKGVAITDATLDGGAASVPAAGQVLTANMANTDSTGWIPVNFSTLTSGSPISGLPFDPVNTIVGAPANVAQSDLTYRYVCGVTGLTYELDARLESLEFTVTNDKQGTDGGNNSGLYEVGTNIQLMGAGVDF